MRKATIILVMSVRLSAWDNSAPTGWSFMKFDIWVFFKTPSRKFKFYYNRTRITSTSHGAQYTLMKKFRSVLCRMRNVSDKSCRENQNTYFMDSNFFFFFQKSCLLWNNVEKYCRAVRPQLTTQRMRVACWIPKTTKTQSEFVILIFHCYDGCTHAPNSYVIPTFSLCLSCYFCYWFNFVTEWLIKSILIT